MNTLELDQRLNDSIIQRRTVDAFQTYYDENVVAQENAEPVREHFYHK